MTGPSSGSYLYQLLHVDPRAHPDVIHAAFRTLTLTRMGKPDQNDAFSRMKEAYDILSDPEKRRTYDEDRLRLNGKIVGSYRILRLIAAGGFGKTYLGEHTRLRTKVCIKHCSDISPEIDEILEREITAVWDLRHYGIPAMREILRLDDGSSAIVMSYIEGETLQHIVERKGRLDAEHMAWILERLLNCLQYMHYNGVVHGDIKPQNIIVQPESHTVVLVDYGLAMVKPTIRDQSIGATELYAPPEQLERTGPLLPESDFYSLGMTAIFALVNNLDRLRRREVPKDSVPEPMREFIRSLVVREITSRPNWQKGDLIDQLKRVREASFGRTRSGMRPLDEELNDNKNGGM